MKLMAAAMPATLTLLGGCPGRRLVVGNRQGDRVGAVGPVGVAGGAAGGRAPSPKFQAYLAIVPSESLDPVPSYWQVSCVQLIDITAVGGTLGLTTETDWVAVLMAPWLSVTVNVTG